MTAESPPPPHTFPTGWRVPVSLLVLAGPIIMSMCSRTALSFVDFVMVSQLGTEAQAAIMPAGIFLFCIIAFGSGVLTAVSTFVSQALGRNDLTACATFAWQGLYLSLIIGFAALPVYPLIPSLFAWAGHDPAVQAMEVVYVRIGLLGLTFALAANALTNFFNGIHKPSVGLWSMVISNIFNVVANYALIFGHFGFPAMGIAGAAWATLLAGVVQTLILLLWMLRPAMERQFQIIRAWRPDIARMRQLLWVGVPAGAQFTVDILAFTIFTLMLVGRFGTVQLAAHNIVFKFLEVSFMPTIGLGVALTAAVGKAIGAQRPDHARLLTRWAAFFSVTYMGIIGAIYLSYRHALPSLLSDDPAVIEYAGRLLLMCAIFQIFDAMAITHMSALRGAGDNHWPAYVSAINAIVPFLLGGFAIAYFLPQWGAMGPWATATIYICLAGLIMWARWTWGPWERIDVFAPKTPSGLVT